MTAYYNDHDEGVCAWLRELIRRGLISDGVVDSRSILDVKPDDLREFTQCHFFAGIGGWSYALRLAGWPDDRPVWTGSPPCQPFSAAGAQKGKDDERHLAPHFAGLIDSVRPPVIFGEQVASAAVFGTASGGAGKRSGGTPEWAWLDDLFERLEASRYACGASDIPAAGIGAPHIRQRTFFGAVRLADAAGERHAGFDPLLWSETSGRDARSLSQVTGGGTTGRLADADSGQRGWVADGEGREHDGAQAGWQQGDGQPERRGAGGRLADAPAVGRREECPLVGGIGQGDRAQGRAAGHDAGGVPGGLGNTDNEGPQERRREFGEQPCSERRQTPQRSAGLPSLYGWPGSDHGGWDTPDWLFCRDGKWRPVEPGTFPLAHGLPARVGRLRGYGNAIVPQAAAEFVGAFDEAVEMIRNGYREPRELTLLDLMEAAE